MPIRGGRRPSVVPITAPSFPTPPRPHVYRKIAYTFLAFTIFIVVGVLWLTSVRADVTVKVARGTVVLDGGVEIAKTPTTGQLPGRVLQDVFMKSSTFEVKAQPPAEPPPTSPNPETPPAPAVNESWVAKGTVRVINKYSRDQKLVKTTRLLTADGKLYRIEKDIVVPKGKEVAVGVYADKPGSTFAIAPTKFTIPGLFEGIQPHIYAVSDQPFALMEPSASAPTPTPTPTPTPSVPPVGTLVTAQHIADAQRTLREQVIEEAKKQLLARLGDASYSEVVYRVREIDKPGSSVSAGQYAERFIASVKLEVTAVYFTKEDMQALVRGKLLEKIPQGREYVTDGAPPAFMIEAVDANAEVATVNVKAEGGYRLTANSASLQKEAVAGLHKDEAVKKLKAVEGVEDATVSISPSWFSKIPALKDHIEVKVE